MKKILILGAGIYQVPLIKKAKEMGIYTIISSIPGDYSGFALADKCYYENTIDKVKILEIAREEKIDGILTSGTDVAVSTIGYVCKNLNLPGITNESARLVTDKALMKQTLLKGSVNTAAYRIAYNQEEAVQKTEEIGTPVIFKCVDSSGSRGIMKVKRISEVPTAFCYVIASTKQEYIVIEEFLNGHEIGVDGFICDDYILLVPHDKIMYNNGKTNVPIGHVFPYECSEMLYHEILTQAKKAILALNLNHCFFNMDMMLCDDKVYVIEVGGRSGATCIPELISLYCGIDYYQIMLDMALGNDIDVKESFSFRGACAGRLLFSDKSGTLDWVRLPEDEDVQISLDFSPGSKVPKFVTGNQRLGQIIVSADSVTNALQKLDEAVNKTILKITC